MEALRQNMISMYGEKGREWLAALAEDVEQLKSLWGLRDLSPFKGLSYHYVMSGYQEDKPIILKLGIDPSSLEREASALRAFAGYGAVKVLKQKKHALLLQKAEPGVSLKRLELQRPQSPIEIACQVMKKLHEAPLPKEGEFPLMLQWLSGLDHSWDLPIVHLQTARRLRDNMSFTQSAPVLLHGDLHRDNILQHGEDWLVIDPKGVIGPPIHEIWASVEDPLHDLPFVAHYFNFQIREVICWYYVHLVLAACWQAEDHLDATLFLALADQILPQIPS